MCGSLQGSGRSLIEVRALSLSLIPNVCQREPPSLDGAQGSVGLFVTKQLEVEPSLPLSTPCISLLFSMQLE